MNVEKDSIYQTRYIRILGWCSCALGGCMFISGIAIHATPQYPDLYQNPAHIAYAYHGQFDNRKPSGQGFIGALLAWAHCLTSYFFSRPRKRNEMVWPSKAMYNGHIALCGLGLVWGVFMAVWDIMIAAGTYYRAFQGGNRVQGFLYFEVALGFILCGIMITSLLLVYKGCQCQSQTDHPQRIYTDRSNYAERNPNGRSPNRRPYYPESSVATVSGQNLDTTATWRPPQLPDGEAPPSYSSARGNGRTNPAFQYDRDPVFKAPQPSQWI